MCVTGRQCDAMYATCTAHSSTVKGIPLKQSHHPYPKKEGDKSIYHCPQKSSGLLWRTPREVFTTTSSFAKTLSSADVRAGKNVPGYSLDKLSSSREEPCNARQKREQAHLCGPPASVYASNKSSAVAVCGRYRCQIWLILRYSEE